MRNNTPCHDCVHVMTLFVLENKYPFFAKTMLAGNGLLLFLIFTLMSNKINHQYLTQTCRGSHFVEELGILRSKHQIILKLLLFLITIHYNRDSSSLQMKYKDGIVSQNK